MAGSRTKAPPERPGQRSLDPPPHRLEGQGDDGGGQHREPEAGRHPAEQQSPGHDHHDDVDENDEAGHHQGCEHAQSAVLPDAASCPSGSPSRHRDSILRHTDRWQGADPLPSRGPAPSSGVGSRRRPPDRISGTSAGCAGW